MSTRSGSRGSRRPGSGGGPSRSTILIGAVLVAIVAAFVAVVILDSRQGASAGAPDGTREIDVGPAGEHTDTTVDYRQTPPAGGDHNSVWQNCGVYPDPVRNETAVHSLEHGAIWISYQPGLPQEQVQRLEQLAEGESYVLLSPFEGLDSPVVASAWGEQLRVDNASDERLTEFKSAFLQGPQTPEPGAACSGGVGEPQ